VVWHHPLDADVFVVGEAFLDELGVLADLRQDGDPRCRTRAGDDALQDQPRQGVRGTPSGAAACSIDFWIGGATISSPVSSASQRAATAATPMITTKRWMRS
jgi:hypothetical protein